MTPDLSTLSRADNLRRGSSRAALGLPRKLSQWEALGSPEAEAAHFEAFSIPEPNSGCWLWLGARAPKGYGSCRHRRRTRAAHHVAYELHRGPITPGLHVLHSCDNPPCVNPAHLFLGTPMDNTRDMMRKGRHRCLPLTGERHGMTRLTTKQVGEIRSLYPALSHRQIAERVGASSSQVGKIIRRAARKDD